MILKTWCYLILIIFGAFPYWNWIQVSGSIKDPSPLSVLFPNKLTWQSPLPPFPSLIWISRHSLKSHQPTRFEFLLTRFNLGKWCYKNEMSRYWSYFSLFPSFTGWEENKLCGAFSFVPVNFTRRHKTGANTNFQNRFPQSFTLKWFVNFAKIKAKTQV